MNICMLASNYLPRQGGAEYAIHHLVLALTKLGHRVRILTEYDASARRITFPYPMGHSFRLPLVSARAKRLLHTCFHHQRDRFDLIHAHMAWPVGGFVCARMKRLFHLPVVVTPHGGDVQTLREIGYGLCLEPHVAAKVRQALRSADLATAVSQRMRVAIAERGLDPERIRWVPCGTEFEAIQRLQAADLRLQLGLSSQDFVVLSVGRNTRVKDMPTLLDGFKTAAAADPRLYCIMIGPDESLREMVDRSGLAERVKLLGRIPSGYDPNTPTDAVFQTPYPEMIAAYRACDVFLSTSLIESFNTAALDAFSCGRPVVVTSTQGFMDVLREGVNGYSVPPRDASAVAEKLLFLARNRDHCRAMGEAALATAAEFDWLKVARLYLRVYEEAIERSAASRTDPVGRISPGSTSAK